MGGRVRQLCSMVLVLALGVPLVAYGAGSEDDSQNESSSQEGAMSNPLLADWDGPFGGVPPFEGVTVADFEAALEAARADLGVKKPQLFMPLRIALTGRKDSPGIFEVMEVLGRERSLERIAAAARCAGEAVDA